jgi:hypothetical protein
MNILTRPDRVTVRSVVIYAIAVIVVWTMIGVPLERVAAQHLASPNLWFDESGQVFLSLGLHQFSPPGAPPQGWRKILEYGYQHAICCHTSPGDSPATGTASFRPRRVERCN